MNITVNADTISLLFDDKGFAEELTALLNAVIDEEIKKADAMNTDLVDECVELLCELENAEAAERLPAVSIEALLHFCHKNTSNERIKIKRALLIAALVAVISSITVAATPALADRANALFEQIAYSLGFASDKTMAENSEVKALYGRFGDELKTTVASKEDIDLSQIEIVAVDEYGYEKVISPSDCEVTRETNFNGDSSQCLIVISYKGCAFSILYTVEE